MHSLASFVQGKSIEGYVYFTEALRNFKNDQRGVTAVEYAIVAAGVGGVVAVAFGTDGTVSQLLTKIFTHLGNVLDAKVLKA